MKKNYYGYCNSDADAQDKIVVVSDTDLLETGFTFDVGDLLAVFFVNENIADNPRLIITVNDTEVEVTNSDDSGKYIKTADVNISSPYLWSAGETIIFVYTQHSNTNSYYWEVVNGEVAVGDTYGKTKLFDNVEDEQNATALQDWFLGDIQDSESEVAATPNLLKRLYKLLRNGDDKIGLSWELANGIDSQSTSPLGYLYFGSDNGNIQKIEIEYPNYETNIINKTSDIETNDGPQNGGIRGPYLTRIIPDNLYFNIDNGLYYLPTPEGELNSISNAIPCIIPYDSNNNMVIGDSGNLITMINMTKPVHALSTLKTESDIYEKNVKLEDKYNPKLEVVKTKVYVDVPANGKSNHEQVSMAQFTHSINYATNETTKIKDVVGIVGFNLNDEDNPVDASYASLWELYYNKEGNYVEFSIRNYRNTKIEVNIDLYILLQEII